MASSTALDCHCFFWWQACTRTIFSRGNVLPQGTCSLESSSYKVVPAKVPAKCSHNNQGHLIVVKLAIFSKVHKKHPWYACGQHSVLQIPRINLQPSVGWNMQTCQIMGAERFSCRHVWSAYLFNMWSIHSRKAPTNIIHISEDLKDLATVSKSSFWLFVVLENKTNWNNKQCYKVKFAEMHLSRRYPLVPLWLK